MTDEQTHRRHNPLLDEWVLCSPGRLDRPWQGEVAAPPRAATASFDPDCYLCPGNTRARGAVNPRYTSTFAFDNDFPALRQTGEDETRPAERGHSLLRAEPARGICRVLCFTPRHDLTLARMPLADVRGVIDGWAAESAALEARDGIGYVQLFENKGAMMGASNPHPHAQLWATEQLPTIPAKKAKALRHYHARHGSDLLGDYDRVERERGDRLVWSDRHWSVVVPYWAVWPFQTMLLPARRVTSLAALDDAERDSLATAVNEVTRRYDALFATDAPYSMGWCPAPTARAAADDRSWRLHGEFLPPLLRSASVRKFVVGYELMAEAQRDLTPEEAAERLRAAL
jgi:UDPglucose--hexose-1-phosphate uridylyltransferase